MVNLNFELVLTTKEMACILCAIRKIFELAFQRLLHNQIWNMLPEVENVFVSKLSKFCRIPNFLQEVMAVLARLVQAAEPCYMVGKARSIAQRRVEISYSNA